MQIKRHVKITFQQDFELIAALIFASGNNQSI